MDEIKKYPAILPMPTQNYSLSIEHNMVRTNMDSGRTRQRRRFTMSANTISVNWDFTDTEFQLFESWVTIILNGGASWFETDVLTGGGVTPHKVRIQAGKYRAKYTDHMRWRVSASLDVEAINRLDPSVLGVVLDTGGSVDELHLLLDSLEQTVNFNTLAL